MQEIWKDISGYEGYYQVSSLGDVKSLNVDKYLSRGGYFISKHERLLKQSLSNGYRVVRLSLRSKCKSYPTHRLVCAAFHENPEHKRTVNHKDGNKLNNSKNNLEWATDSENIQHAYDTRLALGAHKGKFGSRNHLSKRVIQLTMNGVFVNEFAGQREAFRITGISNTSISDCCNGKIESARGFKWKFKE